MTKEEHEQFIVADGRIAAVIRGERERPMADRAVDAWRRGQDGDADPTGWDEEQCWVLPAREDCMPVRLDRWLRERRSMEARA